MKRFIWKLIFLFSLLVITASTVFAGTVCKNHVGGTLKYKKATITEAGSIQQVCANCNKVMATTPLSKVSSISLSQTDYSYDGRIKTPEVIVKDNGGRVLYEDSDYTVSYAAGRKAVGKYKVTVTLKGKYQGKKTLYFTITPPKTQFDIIEVKSTKSVKLTWDQKNPGVSGYKIQYSTTSNFKSGTTTTLTVSGYKNVTKTLSSLVKNKTYYFRIRTYHKENDVVTYSAWSKVQTIALSKYKYSVKQLLNAEKLNPQKTNHKELDALITKIFKKIHKSGMTTEQKVKACYDYLVKNMTYGNGFVTSYKGVYTTFYDERMVNNAYQILTDKIGVCDHYSAAFMVMCRRIGLEAYEINGEIYSSSKGYYSGHAWAYIVLNGQKYIFDPQVQARHTNKPYYYYGKTYAEKKKIYLIDGNYYDPNTFSDFKLTYPAATQKKTMSCTLTASGVNTSVKVTAKQGGKNVAYSAKEFFTPAVKAYGTGYAKLNINITGGSGKYDVMLFHNGGSTPIYTKTITGNINWYLDLSLQYPSMRNYDLVIYDHSDYGSYLAFDDLKFENNF